MAIDTVLADQLRQQLGPIPDPTIQGQFSPITSGPSILPPAAPIGGGGTTGGLGAILKGGTKAAKPSLFSTLTKSNFPPALGVLNKSGIAGGLAKGAAGFGLNIAGNAIAAPLGGSQTAPGRFAQGAGLGAGLGLLLGPMGALAGGLVGGLGMSLLGGGKKQPKAEDILAGALTQSGLDATDQQEINAYYNVITQLSGNSKEAKAEALNQVGNLILQKMQERQAAAAQQQFITNTAGDTAEFIQPYVDQTMADADLQEALVTQLAPTLPPEYRAIVAANSQRQAQASRRFAGSLGSVAQMTPVIMAQQRQLELMQQAGASLYGQALSGALQGGSGGGQGLAQILAGAGIGQ